MLWLALMKTLTASSWAQEIPFEKYTLPNGLQVILHEDHSLPQVVVDIWYDVGSKDELEGRSGFAHLFEHLMFMGTDRLPGSGIDQTMEAYGGWNNAWTMEDATNYYDVGPPELLPTLLWIEADRMESLAKAMTQEKVDLQRDVVRNERRQSYEDEPYGAAWLHIPYLMYPDGHPYDHTVIGSHSDLQKASLQDVKDFFNTWYVPNNASLVVAGDFDPKEVRKQIEAYFGHIPSKPLPTRAVPEAVTQPQLRSMWVEDQVPAPQINALYHTPGAFQPGEAEVEFVAGILGQGESSRLYQKLVVAGFTQDVSVFNMPTRYGSVLVISATLMPGKSMDEVRGIIDGELIGLGMQPPTDAEMTRVRNQLELGVLQGLEPLQGRAERLNRYWAYTGSPDFLAKDLERYRAVTPKSIQDVMPLFWPAKAGYLYVVPEEKK